MGNGIGKFNLCFAGDAGEISRRHHDIAIYLSNPLDEGLGHSFCYIRPDPSRLSSSKLYSDDFPPLFRTISGASISANTFTPLSTLIDPFLYNNSTLDKASSFESSESFAAIPLQPIPRNVIPAVRSGPICDSSGILFGSGPIERGFLSGPIERSFISGPLENQSEQLLRYRPKSKKWAFMKIIKRAISKTNLLPIGKDKEVDWGQNGNIDNFNINNTNLSSQVSLVDDDVDDHELFDGRNVQWAQGKAGEDRIHVVISEEHGWVFVGIYDGFNGPDATDYLLSNLYSNVYKELQGLLWNDKNDENEEKCSCGGEGDLKRKRGENSKKCEDRERSCMCENEMNKFETSDFSSCGSNGVGNVNHTDVLRALSEALRKTEEAYLEIADMMVMENPELALMGSCVLAMLMKGDDVYLMNVGDSRAVLAQKVDLERISEETLSDLDRIDVDEFGSFTSLASSQLTVDHSTSVEEEVERIKSEHRDDSSAITKDRVKGSLKVTRAFGAGFLKQPKWNDALLEMFRIDYVGNSPYISCSPSLYHHRLGHKDRFLILSSDGLYQYFTNKEAVTEVETFIALFPEGDPAQHLIEEVLFRAAKKAGLDFHELLDIPQGDRRKYHDDVSVIIISFEGRIWRSSV